MENVSKIVILFICCCIQLSAQDGSQLSIQDALLEIAKEHKLSLVFNSDNIPDSQVELPTNRSSADQLNAILRGTDLEYRIESNQIYLFVSRNIYGYIEDAANGERLISATIYLPKTGDHAVANEQGYFSLSTIEDSLLLEVSYLGYSDWSKMVYIQDMDRPIVLQLKVDAELKEVIISDLAASTSDQNYIGLNKGTDILLHQNQAVSAIGGEPDIFQAMMRQSGVNAGTDGIGGMHIRGGKNDQNLILLDGVKLYNSGHAFGAFSIINAGIVDQARLYKSGASGANFGRLSSIIDVKTNDPNLNRINASIQATTIATQATLSVPIIKDRIGIMLTGRRTHIDSYIRSKTSANKKKEDELALGETNYNFNDVNLKVLAKINTQNRIYISLYKGQDKYDDDDFIDDIDCCGYYFDQLINYNWQNEFASLRYNLLIGAHTIADFQVSSYQYSYSSFLEWDEIIYDFDEDSFGRDYREFSSGVQNYEVKLGLQTILNNHHLSYGVNVSRKKYNLGELTLEDYFEEPDPFEPYPLGDFLYTEFIGTYDSDEYSIYFTDKLKITNRWMIDAGIYYSLYNSKLSIVVDEEDPYRAQDFHGYFKTIYQLDDNVSIGTSAGSYLQTEHLLTTSDNGYPNDIWAPSTADLPAERSNQIEVFGEIKSKNHTIKLSAYYKQQKNIVFYDTIRALPTLTNIETDYLEEVLNTGDATGYGAEVNYSYIQKDKFGLNIAYTYGKTDYQFDGVNEGEAFPFDFSIPHTFSLGSNIYLHKRLTLSLDWYYATGKPYTLYTSNIIFSPFDRGTEDYVTSASSDDYNSQRLPDSHKLAFSFSTFWNWGKTRNDFSLGIQNAYNRKNVIYQYQLDGEGLQQQLGFSLLPMVRWRVEI